MHQHKTMNSTLTIWSFILLNISLYLVNGQEIGLQCSDSSIVRSSNDFGSELTSKLDAQDNLFISPFSIYVALAMTYLGAGGRTADQMESAFKMDLHELNSRNFHQSVVHLLNMYEDGVNEYDLFLANALFLQISYRAKQTYVSNVREYYSGEVKAVDFANNGENAMNEINSWVAQKTQNKIQRFVSEPLDPSTRLALLNAIYFKGYWMQPFDPEATESGPFYKIDGSVKQVDFMDRPRPSLLFYQSEETGYKFLELPYRGDNIVMLFALPINRETFPDLTMNSSLICNIFNNLRETRFRHVIIPKFRLEYTSQLNNALLGMGIQDLFTTSANLTGISQESLMVSSVLHKTVITVNERGTEATGATGVFMVRLSMLSDPPNFVADHPFLFYIVDKRNKLVLFSGRLMDP